VRESLGVNRKWCRMYPIQNRLCPNSTLTNIFKKRGQDNSFFFDRQELQPICGLASRPYDSLSGTQVIVLMSRINDKTFQPVIRPPKEVPYGYS
jgi:hypothetical protein